MEHSFSHKNAYMGFNIRISAFCSLFIILAIGVNESLKLRGIDSKIFYWTVPCLSDHFF